jgi:hypothetical protein
MFPGATDGARLSSAATKHRRRTEVFRIHRRTLLKAALLPTALLMAAGGSQAAFASQAAATANVTSGIHSTPSPDSYHTMQLSPSSVTVRAGHRTRITVSFQASNCQDLWIGHFTLGSADWSRVFGSHARPA